MDKQRINYGCLIQILVAILIIYWAFLDDNPILGYILSVILLALIYYVEITPRIEEYKEKKSLALIKAKKEEIPIKYPKAFRVYGFSDNRSDEEWDVMEKFEESWQARTDYVKSHYPNGYRAFCKGRNIDIDNSSSTSLSWSLYHKEEFHKISEEKWASFDQEESKRLIEEKPKEDLRIENQTKINIIANRYPNGFARWLLNKREAPNDYQKFAIEESTIKNLENLCLEELLSCVQSWCSVGDLKVFSMYPYYPTTCEFEVSYEHWDVRRMIWDFKTGALPNSLETYLSRPKLFQLVGPSDSINKSRCNVIHDLKIVLSYFFDNKEKDLTLVCINASTNTANIFRYKEFSSELCSITRMENAYPHILITKDGTPKHTGGKEKAELTWNEAFFKGKFVILFDDVITKGTSMLTYKYKLEEMGAYVIGGITIGKTSHKMDYSEFPIYTIRRQLRQRQKEETGKREWTVIWVRPFSDVEIACLNSAVIVSSETGASVCFHFKDGHQKFVPLAEDSKLGIGETLDISKAILFLLTKDDFHQTVVDGPPLCVGPPDNRT